MKYRIIAVVAIALLPSFALAQSNGSGGGKNDGTTSGTHNQGTACPNGTSADTGTSCQK